MVGASMAARTEECTQTAPAPVAETFGVLVVDDSEANRDVLSRRLQRRGYRVATAADGNQALELLTEIRFDLVLLDIMMPGLSGLDVLQIIRQKYGPAELPVIMATAKDSVADIVQALELGANDYVTKPLDFPIVLARVQTQLSLRGSVRQILNLEQRLRQHNEQLEAVNAQLQLAHDRMRLDLLAAARVQEALLPKSALRVPGFHFAWAFHPCAELAGDALNVCRLDERHVGLYVLDVSGHGVAAALLAVTVTRALSPAAGPDSLLLRADGNGGHEVVPPAEITQSLDQHFPWDASTEQFFTIAYGLLDTESREFHYVCAGHPGPAYLPRGGAANVLKVVGLPIGLGGRHEQHTQHVESGDRLYLYSDGVTDAFSPDGEEFGAGRLLQTLERGRDDSLDESVNRLQEELTRWRGRAEPHDDVSIIGVEVA
jgi:sigma-B regulation protein RsbU (phosphoserine phosphatase)